MANADNNPLIPLKDGSPAGIGSNVFCLTDNRFYTVVDIVKDYLRLKTIVKLADTNLNGDGAVCAANPQESDVLVSYVTGKGILREQIQGMRSEDDDYGFLHVPDGARVGGLYVVEYMAETYPGQTCGEIVRETVMLVEMDSSEVRVVLLNDGARVSSPLVMSRFEGSYVRVKYTQEKWIDIGGVSELFNHEDVFK